MITLMKIGDRPNTNSLEIWGKSTDEKPIGQFEGVDITNCSTYFAFDTKEMFAYDKDTDTWVSIG